MALPGDTLSDDHNQWSLLTICKMHEIIADSDSPRVPDQCSHSRYIRTTDSTWVPAHPPCRYILTIDSTLVPTQPPCRYVLTTDSSRVIAQPSHCRHILTTYSSRAPAQLPYRHIYNSGSSSSVLVRYWSPKHLLLSANLLYSLLLNQGYVL